MGVVEDLQYLTVKDLERIIHKDRVTLYDMVRRGVGPEPTRIGRRILFSREAVEKFMKDSTGE